MELDNIFGDATELWPQIQSVFNNFIAQSFSKCSLHGLPESNSHALQQAVTSPNSSNVSIMAIG